MLWMGITESQDNLWPPLSPQATSGARPAPGSCVRATKQNKTGGGFIAVSIPIGLPLPPPGPQTLPCLGATPGGAAVVGCLPQAAAQQWQWAGASGLAKECLPDLWLDPSILTVVDEEQAQLIACIAGHWIIPPLHLLCCGAIVGTTRS